MSTISPDGSEDFPDIKYELDLNVATFEASEENYLEKSAAYFHKPTNNSAKVLGLAVFDHIVAFEAVAQNLISGDSTEHVLKDCAGLIKRADENRSHFFNALTKSNLTKPLGESFRISPQTADGSPLGLSEEVSTALLGFVTTAFTQYVEYDTNLLLQAAAETSEAKRIRFMHELTRHGIDVGKVTLGVAIGTLLARRFNSHSSG